MSEGRQELVGLLFTAPRQLDTASLPGGRVGRDENPFLRFAQLMHNDTGDASRTAGLPGTPAPHQAGRDSRSANDAAVGLALLMPVLIESNRSPSGHASAAAMTLNAGAGDANSMPDSLAENRQRADLQQMFAARAGLAPDDSGRAQSSGTRRADLQHIFAARTGPGPDDSGRVQSSGTLVMSLSPVDEASEIDGSPASARKAPRMLPGMFGIAENTRLQPMAFGTQLRPAVPQGVAEDLQSPVQDGQKFNASTAAEAKAGADTVTTGLLPGDASQPTLAGRTAPGSMSEMPAIQRQAAAQTLDRILIMSKAGTDHARLQLNPPELGRVDIRMELDGNDTRLQLVVQNSVARESMEAMLPKLRDALAQQGLELHDASILEQGDGNARDDAPGDDAARDPARVSGLADGSDVDEAHPAVSTVSVDGVLDTYA